MQVASTRGRGTRSSFTGCPRPLQTDQLLRQLPARLEWVVFFRLAAILPIFDAATIRAMYFLAPDQVLADFSHVVLTSEGRYLAPAGAGPLVAANGQGPLALGDEAHMLQAHGAGLARWPLAEADCIGIGRRNGQPALLFVRIADGVGQAEALLAVAPPSHCYDMLPAIGVDHLGTEAVAGGWLARFRNRLPLHVKAGLLGGFARTHNCNIFFMDQAVVTPEIAGGLQSAFDDRLRWARGATGDLVRQQAARCADRPPAMTCRPPAPAQPFAYGDLVPLGLLLRGLRALPPAPDAALFAQLAHGRAVDRLESLLMQRRIGELWPFHTARLPTATDSCLVMLGLPTPGAVAALARFTDGKGGVLPQLAAGQADTMHMEAAPCNAHWRQADFATTCLAAALRAAAAQPALTPADWFGQRFASRSGLYFAHPFLVDWCLAMAIREREDLAALRAPLQAELLAAANADGSFGRWDPVLGTTLAILALDALGERGPALRLAQTRLINMLEDGDLPATTPFYSTELVEGTPAGATIDVEGQPHALSLYEDAHRIFLMGAVAVALAVQAQPRGDAPAAAAAEAPHPRYRCASAADYIARFALPPYQRALRVAAIP